EVITCERFYWDLRNDRALIAHGEVSSWVAYKDQRVPLTARADEFREVAPGVFKTKTGSLTNCTYGRPHWHVQLDDLTLTDEPDGLVEYEASDLTVRAGELPVFWFPYASGTAGEGDSFYFRNARFGHSSRFGYFLFTEWGHQIRLPGEKKPWGDWTLHIDPMEKRGVGVGFDVDYKTPDYRGLFYSYYIHDEGDHDRNSVPIEEEDRGRIRFEHRQFLSKDLTLDVEANYLSDPNFLNEFFEREFKEEKPP